MSFSSAWSPAPSDSDSPSPPAITTPPSPPLVADDITTPQISPISLASPPTPLLPPPPPPPQVVASPPTSSEPPLPTPDPLPPPLTPTQPVSSPPPLPLPPPIITPPPPPSETATPIAPGPLPSQPPPPSLTSPSLPTTPLPPETSPPPPSLPTTPLPPETSPPPPSQLTPETSSPSPSPSPPVPLSPTTVSPPPPSATHLTPRTHPLSPPTPTRPTESSSPPPALASRPPLPASPQAPNYLTSPPLVNGVFPVSVGVQAKPGTGRFHVSTGLAVGCLIGVVLLLIIVLGLFCVCCQFRRKKKQRSKEDDYKFPISALPKDNCNAVKPLHQQQNVLPLPLPLPPGAPIIRVLSNPCPPPTRMSSNGGSASTISGFQNPISPQAPGVTLGFSCGMFTYDQLVVATNGFSEANLLGQGGFGYVHKGVLPSGQEVAVKQLKMGSHQGEREFQAEVDTISRVHHKHLVSLVGYCITGAERLLVYEFVPNNTLDFHLRGEGQPVLEWASRVKIAIGSAKGLAYLHQDCNPTVIHRDIKASNILLDFRFEAKVSDFGLAKIFSDTNTHISTRVVGTFGYLAPEYASSGKVTDKSDVYSYGVVLLELITGRPPIGTTESSRNEGLVAWARPLLSQALEDGNFDALVDPRLQSNYDTSEMARMVACAAACVRHSAWLRPRMSQIVHALERHVSLTHLDGGITPGHSTLYSSSTSSNYDAQKHLEDIKKFNMALASQEYGISRYSETTSEYGVNPSCSSSEVQ